MLWRIYLWGKLEYTGKTTICWKSLTSFLTECCMEYTSSKLTMLLVIGVYHTIKCNSKHHTIAIITTPSLWMRASTFCLQLKIGKFPWERNIYHYQRLHCTCSFEIFKLVIYYGPRLGFLYYNITTHRMGAGLLSSYFET